MKKELKPIKCALIAFVFFALAFVLNLLEKEAGIVCYVQSLDLNFTNFVPFFYVVSILWLGLAVNTLTLRKVKRKQFRILIFVLVAVLSVLFICLQFLFYEKDVFVELDSANGEHVIYASEKSWLQSGTVAFYEKISPVAIKRLGSVHTDDGFLPIENSTYNIVWNDDGFSFEYKLREADERYKIRRFFYLK